MDPEIEIKLRGKPFKIEAFKGSDGQYVWKAYRKLADETWEKIPCFSRAEENAFPKDVAWAATAFIAGLNYREVKV